MMRFENQVAVITGAANGIGKACAQRFAQEGAFVACLDVTDELNQAVAEEVRALGVGAIALHCDVTEAESIQAAIDAVMEKWGRVDVLVASAAFIPVNRCWK